MREGPQSQGGDTQREWGGRRRIGRGDEIQAGTASTCEQSLGVGTSLGWGAGCGPRLPPPPPRGHQPRMRLSPAPRCALDPNTTPPPRFPGECLGRRGAGGRRGRARPSLCRGAPVEPTPRRISPVGRYRSGPAKLDTRALQPSLQLSYKEEEGAYSPGRPCRDSEPE